ncbi:MAG: DNA polymerase IV [Candidatus Nanopelagicales bacterium]
MSEFSEVTPILHVDMDAFYASVEIRDDEKLLGIPVIVGGGSNRSVVLSATYEARALGVKAAMPMSQARRLAPQAIIVSPNFELYAEISRQVMEVFHSFTPLVEPLSLDEAFLDVSGSRKLIGEPLALAQQIRERIWYEQGITCSVGVAPNKFVAKLASTAIKPNGVLQVLPNEVISFLHPLPIGALWGVGAKTEELLRKLGIKKVADLAYLSEGILAKVIGSSMAEHLINLAWGRDERRVIAERSEKSISNEMTFAYDLADTEEIEKYLYELGLKVSKRLKEHDYLAGTISIKLRAGDFSTLTRSKTLLAPTNTTYEIYQVTKSLLAQTKNRKPVRLLGVKAEKLLPQEDAWNQLDLGQIELAWLKADSAMAKVQNKFGDAALLPARLLESDDNLE